MKNGRSRAGSPGFTSIELLVVVSMIMLLVGLPLPSLGRARQQARRVACGSNLRQVGLAMHMYTTDSGYPNTDGQRIGRGP